MKERFDDLNKQVADGYISINQDLTITQFNDEADSMLMRGVNEADMLTHDTDYRNTYWWWQSIGYCNRCAKEAIHQARRGSSDLSLLGYIPGGWPTCIVANWFSRIADDMDYARTDDGVIFDLNYTMVYNCYGR